MTSANLRALSAIVAAFGTACLPPLEVRDLADGRATASDAGDAADVADQGAPEGLSLPDAHIEGDAKPSCDPGVCAAEGTDCKPGTCVATECVEVNAPAGSDCDDGGGARCDGAGLCVRCRADTTKNDGETDTDCGGPDCPKCADLLACEDGSDCASGSCDESVCVPATCSDGAPNGDEADVDCGGPSCVARCTPGKLCGGSGDCSSGSCGAGICCGAECSGVCRECAPGTGACDFVAVGLDPRDECSGAGNDCDGAGGCEQCADLTKNGDETDFDCGGEPCAPCAVGAACLLDRDCETCACMGGACVAPACDDGALGSCETDVDCGGPCGATCTLGQACARKADCVSLSCAGRVCVTP